MPSETRISFSDGGSSETLRKFSDDYSRKHLADHSVVLTEDTDSFIIGDRVWVGGSKPGQIAYIGETQFAPGEWAGIVLDDPIGKNDGSVAGTRYFQCSERRGVFSRLTRLTRSPLFTPASSISPHAASPASDAGSVFAPGSVKSARPRRALSPNGSIRSAVSSKMNQSVTSTAAGGELRLGDRVIVSSSQGSKAGALRYTGPTDFASGIWCGVELDDPIGKNDGSVEGKRYFECSPRFGLFAPISKVSRSPSNRKPGACAIHSNGRTPLRRSNSRESLTSLGTSIASSMRTASRAGVRLGVTSLGGAQRSSGPRASSTPVSAKNALQEMLREKQQHLERLMRERELERAEVAKFSLQADRAEGALQQARKDSAQVASENEKLKAELLSLGKLLEDERQRVEDLMFRTEEDNINKEDYNKFKQAMETERAAAEKRIQQLEAEVVLLSATTETARASVAAADDKHAQEMEAMTGQHREEIQAAQMLSAELQKLLDEAYALLKEKENEKDSLGKSMSEELVRARAESEKALSEAKSKLSIAQTEFEAQLSVLNAKLQMSETKLETEKQNSERLCKDTSQTILELNSKVAQIQAALDDKTHELNKALGASKEQELSLTKEITKLKMEMSAKVMDIEHLSDTNKKYEVTNKALESEIATIREDFTKKINEYETLLNETSQQNDKYSAEVMELQQKLSMKTSEYEKLLNESKDSNSATTKAVEEYKKLVSERDKEIVKLKHEYEEATANFNKSHAIIAEEHKKLIDDRNQQIEKLLKEIEGHRQIIDQHRNDFDVLNLKIKCNVDEMKVLNDQNGQLNLSVVDLTKSNVELNAKIAAMELEIGELNRQLNSSNEKCAELQSAKEKVESEYLNLTTNSTNSNEEINKLSQYLREAEKELQEARDKFREKSNDHERLEQELRQQLNQVQQAFVVEKEELIQKLAKTQEDLTTFEDKVKELDIQLLVFKEQITKQEVVYNTLLNDMANLGKEIESRKTKEAELQSQLEEVSKQSEKAIEVFKQKVDVLKADSEMSEVKLKEKVDQLVVAQNDLNNRLEQAQKNEMFLQKKLEKFTEQSNNERTVLDKELKQKNLELLAIKEDINKSVSRGTKINDLIEEKDNIIKELNLKLAMLEVDMKSYNDVISEKERQITVSGQEIARIIEDKQEVEKKLSVYQSEVSTLQQKYESIISDKSGSETIVKEQQEKIESLVKDLESSSKENTTIENKFQELSEELSKLNMQHQEIIQQMEMVNENKIQLTNLVQEKDNLIKADTEKILRAEANVKSLESERDKLQKLLEEKLNAISEKEKQLSQLHERLHLGSSESSTQIELLNKQIENTTKTHKSEIEALQKIIKTLESNSKDKDAKLQELNKSNEKITELQALLSKTEEDIKQLTKINDGQKANYEDLNKQLQSEYEKLKKDSKKERHTLKDKLQELEKALHESKDKINVEISKQAELQTKLTESEKNAQELANKVEILTVHQKNTSTEQDSMLEKVTLELQSVRRTGAEALAANEEIISKLRIEVENKINDLLKNEDRIAKLEEELRHQKAKTEIAQREKHLIQKEIATKEKDSNRKENYDNGITKANGPADESALKLLEEKELIEGQVSFLNSVIVDMQRKNEQLLARVQALETGFSPDNDYDFSMKKKEVAPRLFCDICDVFDAHDTEDCPRQAGEAPQPLPPAAASARKPPPAPRPYCDICEVFGHSTENCDEEETF